MNRESKSILTYLLIIMMPLFRGFLLNDFLVIFWEPMHQLYLRHYYPPFKVLGSVLIAGSFYIPFFVIFAKGTRYNALIYCKNAIAFQAGFGLLILVMLQVYGADMVATYIFLPLITPIAFLVESILLAVKIQDLKDYSYSKSFLIVFLSFLVFPVLMMLVLSKIIVP